MHVCFLCSTREEDSSTEEVVIVGEKIINPEIEVIFVREVKGGEENEVVIIGEKKWWWPFSL